MKTAFMLGFLLVVRSLAASEPPVFTTKSFEEAKSQSIKEHKLLVADATAVWCGPCKQMDKTTWVDDKVVAWITKNAIAVQVDVDKDKELAKGLGIRAMPTLIVFKEGAEVDRDEGYKSPEDLIPWLESLKSGKPGGDPRAAKMEELRKKAYEPVTDEHGKHANIDARLHWAKALAMTRREDEATDEYVWLWENMNREDPDFVGVRSSFMAGDMGTLARSHPAARKRFAALRDSLEANLKAGTSTSDELSDWMVLNTVVDDDRRTIDWYHRVKDDPLARADIERNDYRLKMLFEQRKDWADVASLSRNPEADAKGELLSAQIAIRVELSQNPNLFKEGNLDSVLGEVTHLYAGLLALGREEDADKVAAVLIGAIDHAVPRRALVRMALEAEEPRRRQISLLDQADKLDPNHADRDLRDRLTAATTPLSESQKIDGLLARLMDSDAVFIRNGEEHIGVHAAAHLRTKLDAAGGRVKTAREFIEQVASRSSVSGEVYKVKTKEGRTLDSREWFTRELDSIERRSK